MSKHTLVLVRHCKASMSSAGSDMQRPLSTAGQAQAEELGRQMKDMVRSLSVVLVSPALRARQTWDGIARGAGLTEGSMPLVKVEDKIYEGGAMQIMEVARLGSTGYTSMVIGHEPTISSAVSLIVKDGEDAKVAHGMSTGSAAVVVADKNWHEWHSHVGTMVDLVHVPA